MSTQYRKKTRNRRKWLATAALLSAAAVALTACGSSGTGGSSKNITLVGFSVLKGVDGKATTAFEKTAAGKGVTVTPSYDASGAQSRAVLAGAPADLVQFSLATDLTKLVDAGLVSKDWNAGPTKGIASQSVVVFVVRPGNPKHITSWDDLVDPSKKVSIVTPDPTSSGSARWNVMAAWAHATAHGGGDAAGTAYLKKFFARVATYPTSASQATTAFESGTGDVLISYENEAIEHIAAGEKLQYVVPSDTMLIQNPAAVTKKAPAVAASLLSFIESAAGQKIYAEEGFRPLPGVNVGSFTTPGANDPAHPFPVPATLYNIDQFGGWSTVATKFFADQDGIVTKIVAGAKG